MPQPSESPSLIEQHRAALIEAAERTAASFSAEDLLSDQCWELESKERENLTALARRLVTGSAFAPRYNYPQREEVEALATIGRTVFSAAIDARRADLAAERIRDRSSRKVPPPAAQPYGVSPAGAEQLAADWMRHLDAQDVRVTRGSRDGGVDVETSAHIVQVKAWSGPVGVVEVRVIAGIAAHDGRAAVIIATTGFTEDARIFAGRANVAAFVMNPMEGTLSPVTLAARSLLHGETPGDTLE